MDPRIEIIGKRLSGVRRLIAVTGGKGGIGKSFVASTLALLLAEEGRRVGLLDLDLTGPCDHVILGIREVFPEEKFGLVPPCVHGIHFMSITHFAGENPSPLRGDEVSQAFIEMLAITQWGEIDFLIIDMPPGLGDATLDAIRLLPRLEFLLIATSSRVVLETVSKTLQLLTRLHSQILGVVENMQRHESTAVKEFAAAFNVPHLGAVPFDESLEEAVGHPEKLIKTRAAMKMRGLAEMLS